MMELLTKWADEHPDEKVLIISQWTQCLDLVSNYLLENHIGHVKSVSPFHISLDIC